MLGRQARVLRSFASQLHDDGARAHAAVLAALSAAGEAHERRGRAEERRDDLETVNGLLNEDKSQGSSN